MSETGPSGVSLENENVANLFKNALGGSPSNTCTEPYRFEHDNLERFVRKFLHVQSQTNLKVLPQDLDIESLIESKETRNQIYELLKDLDDFDVPKKFFETTKNKMGLGQNIFKSYKKCQINHKSYVRKMLQEKTIDEMMHGLRYWQTIHAIAHFVIVYQLGFLDASYKYKNELDYKTITLSDTRIRLENLTVKNAKLEQHIMDMCGIIKDSESDELPCLTCDSECPLAEK